MLERVLAASQSFSTIKLDLGEWYLYFALGVVETPPPRTEQQQATPLAPQIPVDAEANTKQPTTTPKAAVIKVSKATAEATAETEAAAKAEPEAADPSLSLSSSSSSSAESSPDSSKAVSPTDTAEEVAEEVTKEALETKIAEALSAEEKTAANRQRMQTAAATHIQKVARRKAAIARAAAERQKKKEQLAQTYSSQTKEIDKLELKLEKASKKEELYRLNIEKRKRRRGTLGADLFHAQLSGIGVCPEQALQNAQTECSVLENCIGTACKKLDETAQTVANTYYDRNGRHADIFLKRYHDLYQKPGQEATRAKHFQQCLPLLTNERERLEQTPGHEDTVSEIDFQKVVINELLSKHKQEQNAASKIQTKARQIIARKRIARRRFTRRRIARSNAAATIIQTVARQTIAKTRVTRGIASATTIQTVARQRIARSEMAIARTRIARRVEAATTIQTVARQRNDRRNAAATTIQTRARPRARDEVARRNAAATTIQTRARPRARDEVARRNAAATTIQKIARGKQGRAKAEREAEREAAAKTAEQRVFKLFHKAHQKFMAAQWWGSTRNTKVTEGMTLDELLQHTTNKPSRSWDADNWTWHTDNRSHQVLEKLLTENGVKPEEARKLLQGLASGKDSNDYRRAKASIIEGLDPVNGLNEALTKLRTTLSECEKDTPDLAEVIKKAVEKNGYRTGDAQPKEVHQCIQDLSNRDATVRLTKASMEVLQKQLDYHCTTPCPQPAGRPDEYPATHGCVAG